VADDEGDEACFFPLEGGEDGPADHDDDEAGFVCEMMVGVDGGDDEALDVLRSAPAEKVPAARLLQGRTSFGAAFGGRSASPPLGASVILLSALEQVAAEINSASLHFRPGTL